MKVALIRNVQESRSLSMPFYANSLRDALGMYCEVVDVYLKPDFFYQLAGATGPRIQEYVGRFWSLPRQIRGLQADVFHIVDQAYAHLLYVLDPARTVVTCHDLILPKASAGEIPWYGVRPWVASKTYRWSVDQLRRAKVVLCDSESTKRDAVTLIGCNPERTRVVYLGLHELFRQVRNDGLLEEARRRFGITWPVTILHVGNSMFYKNLEGIIEALVLFPPDLRKNVHLVKVGWDLTPEQWELIRRRGLNERVHFLGQLNLEDLVLIYNLSDILLFPSLYEGFGWPPLEAMACGTPVVCSDRGSLKEVVGDAVIIVDPEDPKEIAQGVERVLVDKELRETLVTRGLERAKHFNWDRTAKQVLEIYNEILGGQTELSVAEA